MPVNMSTPKPTRLGELGEPYLTFPKGSKSLVAGWQFLALGVWCQGSYLMCMLGKRLGAGHHTRSPFVQLSQLLSSLIKGNARTSQVPNDASCSTSHTFNPTRPRDMLGKTARGFSCCGLANCKRETDKERGMSPWPWLCQCFSSSGCSLTAVMPFDAQMAHVEDVALCTATPQSCCTLSSIA